MRYCGNSSTLGISVWPLAPRPAAKPHRLRKTSARRASAGRKLKPSARSRGLEAQRSRWLADHEEIRPLMRASSRRAALRSVPTASARGRALVLATLPFRAIQPTPFQRDLSPTHTKRLSEKIDEPEPFSIH